MTKTKPVVLLGYGGHAKVLLDMVELNNIPVLGISDPNISERDRPDQYQFFTSDEDVSSRFKPFEMLLVNAIGTVGHPQQFAARALIYDKFKSKGYQFATLVHPSANVSVNSFIGEGTQVMAGAVIQPGCTIGENTIVNTRSSIDHDCLIGKNVHISPGAVLCGGVTIGSGSHIGAGAVIIQNIKVGSGCTVAAGSVVVRDIPDGHKVMGVPARRVTHEKMG